MMAFLFRFGVIIKFQRRSKGIFGWSTFLMYALSVIHKESYYLWTPYEKQLQSERNFSAADKVMAVGSD